MEGQRRMTTIPSKICVRLISAIPATTVAVIQPTAADILPVQVMETIRPVQDQAPDLTVVRDLDPTQAAVMTIITVENRRNKFPRTAHCVYKTLNSRGDVQFKYIAAAFPFVGDLLAN